jgi:hypothetical protein
MSNPETLPQPIAANATYADWRLLLGASSSLLVSAFADLFFFGLFWLRSDTSSLYVGSVAVSCAAVLLGIVLLSYVEECSAKTILACIACLVFAAFMFVLMVTLVFSSATEGAD